MGIPVEEVGWAEDAEMEGQKNLQLDGGTSGVALVPVPNGRGDDARAMDTKLRWAVGFPQP